MPPRLSRTVCHRLSPAPAWCGMIVAVAASVGGWCGARSVAGAAEAAYVVDATTGPLTGRLERLDAAGVQIVVDGQPRTLPLDTVRTVGRPATATTPSTLSVTCSDGSTLAGTDVAWQGDVLSISHPAGAITLPIARVQSIAWHDAAGDGRWQAALPAGIESDVIVVRKGDDFEFVECAITGISADTVSVVLDEQTIPVKRAKVMGLQWLRERQPLGRINVRIDGGAVRAKAVAWTPTGLIIDDAIRLPADMLVEVDYASGRTVHVAGLTPERVEVEPFFGALGKIDGLEDYFRPRPLPATAEGPLVDLLVRPRSVIVWRIPPESREFRTALSATAASGTGPLVVIAIDDREVFRGAIDQATGADGRVSVGPFPVEAGRRLRVTVDFGSAGAAGGAVVLHDPVLSQ